MNIMLAEDHLINQKIMLLMLKKLGHQADVAINGIEVLQMLERKPYDVILMDVGMPEIDGLQATRFIRQYCLAAEQPYIIAVTAYGNDARETCIDAGMNDFVSKPVGIEELRSALQYVKQKLHKVSANTVRRVH